MDVFRRISTLATQLGYRGVNYRIDEIEVMESCLAFTVFTAQSWPKGYNLHLAGALVRAWIAWHVGQIAHKEPGLYCSPAGILGNTVVHDTEIELPLWVLGDREGQTGPLQVLFSEDLERECLYIQVGLVMFTGLPAPDYYRLLGRLGEAFNQHYKHFSISNSTTMVSKASIYILAATSGSVIGGTILNILTMGNYSFEGIWLWGSALMGAYVAYFGLINKWRDEDRLSRDLISLAHRRFVGSMVLGLLFFLSFEETLSNLLIHILGSFVDTYSAAVRIMFISMFGTFLSGLFAIWDSIRENYDG